MRDGRKAGLHRCKHGIVRVWKSSKPCAKCVAEQRALFASIFHDDEVAARDNNANSDLRKARTARFHLDKLK